MNCKLKHSYGLTWCIHCGREWYKGQAIGPWCEKRGDYIPLKATEWLIVAGIMGGLALGSLAKIWLAI
jgi:hypothetical protein